MYMTKPKQVQKSSENTGKTFSVIMPPFTSRGGRGGGIITEMTVQLSFEGALALWSAAVLLSFERALADN